MSRLLTAPVTAAFAFVAVVAAAGAVQIEFETSMVDRLHRDNRLQVDSDVIVIAMIAVGIAVDDTIHFLTRLRTEASRTSSVDTALQRTFELSGRAIIRTSMILCLGFLPFALSDYSTTRHLGTLLALTLVVALLSDLLLLPAMVSAGMFPLKRVTRCQGRVMAVRSAQPSVRERAG